MGTISLVALALAMAAPSAVSDSTSQAFASELRYFDTKRKPNENLVFSPVGIQLAGTAVMMGSQGTTRAGLMKALGVAAGNDLQLPGDFRDLLAQYGAGSEMGMYCSLWLHRTNPTPVFRKSLSEFLNTEIHEVPDYRVVHEQVNDWVRQSTKSRITQILERQEADFAFAAVSANTFDGEWPTPLTLFGPESDQAIAFRPESGAAVKVATLRTSAACFALSEGREMLTIAYKTAGARSRYALVLVVPPEGQPARELVQSLSMTEVRTVLRQGAAKDTPLVSLPKFKIESAPDLKSYLIAAGAKQAFEPSADFAPFGPRIYLAEALHKATIEVDEVGTRASSATVITGTRGGAPRPPRKLIVDRPFVFMVYDRQADMPLFGGVVAKV